MAFTGCTKEKTAYVDTMRLIQEYSEMEDVESNFTKRAEELKQQFDSIAIGFQDEVRVYQENMTKMNQEQRQKRENELMQKQQALQQQQQMRSEQLKEESDQAVDSLVSKVREFVKTYGEENGYTYIFGSNESANIMFAKEGLDITDEILEELNSIEVNTEE